jgi:hypothetical protein
MLEAVISLETFLFVEWCYTELADVSGFTPFLQVARTTLTFTHFNTLELLLYFP